VAEILRVPLEQLCLQIKALKLGDVIQFLNKALEPPSAAAIKMALMALTELAAMDDSGELTALGHHVAELPVDAHIGKMILYGAIFNCLDPVLTIAAAVSGQSVFTSPVDRREAADAAKRALASQLSPTDFTFCSDHLAVLRAYTGWQAAKGRGKGPERAYLSKYFLSASALKNMQDLKRQFAELLAEIGFVSSKVRTRTGDGVIEATGHAVNLNRHCLPLVRAVVCAGLYPNIAVIEPRAGFNPAMQVGEFCVHPCEFCVDPCEFSVDPCEFCVHPCEFCVDPCEFGVDPCEFCVDPCEFCVHPCEFCVDPCEFGVDPCEFCVHPCEFCVDPCEFGVDPCEFCVDPCEFCVHPCEFCVDPCEFCVDPCEFCVDPCELWA
jgi:hypothetical protein